MNSKNRLLLKAFNKQSVKLAEMVEKEPELKPPRLIKEESGITYYDLRQFIAVIRKYTKDEEIERMAEKLLKTLAKLEIRSVPVPHIRKMGGGSPVIFDIDTSDEDSSSEEG